MATFQQTWVDENLCGGKNKYNSQNEAERMKESIGRKRGKDLRIYFCKMCHTYHLTKKQVSDKHKDFRDKSKYE